METYKEPIVDRHGKIMFWCDRCSTPISRSDVLDLGMRLPDLSESADDYRDAELIDSFCHSACTAATKAG